VDLLSHMPSQMSTALQKLKNILGDENIAALVYGKRGTRFMYNEATFGWLFISMNFVQNFTQMIWETMYSNI